MAIQAQFRRAYAEEADLLNEMTLAGVRHWGHHLNHPDAYNGLAGDLPTPNDVAENPVFVLTQDDEVIGFYGLRQRADHVELLRMFQKVDLIGRGYGRIMWDHCVLQAAEMSDRMKIVSDPESIGFYKAMGAILHETREAAPGFSLGVMWYDLK